MNHCANCFHFLRISDSEGECHGSTPQPVLHALSDASRRVSWPLVYDNAGCSTWQPEPAAQKTDGDLRLEVVARALGLRDQATVEEIITTIDTRRKITESLAKRIAAQSELLSSKAERADYLELGENGGG